MASRNLLHLNKVEAFKLWLDRKNIAYRDGKGDYELLQVNTPNFGWQKLYRRHDMSEHITVQDKLVPLVKTFIRGSHDK